MEKPMKVYFVRISDSADGIELGTGLYSTIEKACRAFHVKPNDSVETIANEIGENGYYETDYFTEETTEVLTIEPMWLDGD
jgi:hypothetical protein